ncbi:MAG TPA: NAD(P)-binding protein, partial [Dongiaceae bacterium]|nr:NAD(P)-binding protein [Dongiaceae bacterium]
MQGELTVNAPSSPPSLATPQSLSSGGAPRPRVVVLGAGFAGLTAAKHLAGVNVDLTLIDRHNYHL